jgi:hypothetical protein
MLLKCKNRFGNFTFFLPQLSQTNLRKKNGSQLSLIKKKQTNRLSKQTMNKEKKEENTWCQKENHVNMVVSKIIATIIVNGK